MLKRIEKGDTLLVKGPASVRLTKGCAKCLDIDMNVEKPILVRKGKTLPFECYDDCEFWLILGEGSSSEIRNSSEGVGTKIWSDLVKEIKEKKPSCVMLVGENDSGKSTLTAYIANLCLNDVDKVWIVDGDLGQADLAPPGCLGLSLTVRKITDLRDLVAKRFSFIGLTSPYKAMNLVINELAKLRNYAEKNGSKLTVVNTDGFVKDEGLVYKLNMARAIKPDLVACIEDGEEMERAFSNNGWDVIKVNKPRGTYKNHAERSERRLLQYRRFLKGSKRMNIDLKLANFHFLGKTYFDVSKFQNHHYQGLKAISKDSSIIRIVENNVSFIVHKPNGEEIITSFQALKEMFVGLGRAKNDELEIKGFGVVEKIGKKFQTIISSTTNDFDTIVLSAIKLTRGLEEEKMIPIIYQK